MPINHKGIWNYKNDSILPKLSLYLRLFFIANTGQPWAYSY